MKVKIIKYAAQFFSGVFNPFMIPTIGLLLIMGLIPGIEFFSMKMKMILFGVVFLSTCLIPLVFIVLNKLHRGWNNDSSHFFDGTMPYLYTAMCAFFGSQILGKLPFPGIFQVFLLGISFMMVISIIITIKWRISGNSIALGGLWGVFIALNFKYGMDILWLIILLILISGVVGSSRIYLKKDSPQKVYTGFMTGMVCMFFFMVFL